MWLQVTGLNFWFSQSLILGSFTLPIVCIRLPETLKDSVSRTKNLQLKNISKANKLLTNKSLKCIHFLKATVFFPIYSSSPFLFNVPISLIAYCLVTVGQDDQGIWAGSAFYQINPRASDGNKRLCQSQGLSLCLAATVVGYSQQPPFWMNWWGLFWGAVHLYCITLLNLVSAVSSITFSKSAAEVCQRPPVCFSVKGKKKKNSPVTAVFRDRTGFLGHVTVARSFAICSEKKL